MVELPGEPCVTKCKYSLPNNSVLASYERGIHYVAISPLQLRVWMLTESEDGQLGWTLAHEACLNLYDRIVDTLAIQPRVTWGVVDSRKDKLVSLFEDMTEEDINEEEEDDNDDEDDDDYDDDDDDDDNDDGDDDDNDDDDDEEEEEEEEEEEDTDEDDGNQVEELRSRSASEYSWNSDEDNFINIDVCEVQEASSESASEYYGNPYKIMGFHPHKHVLILLLGREVMAYHLDTSRMQYLGKKYDLMNDHEQQAHCVYGSFPYRPCYVDVLPTRNSSVPSYIKRYMVLL
jgi:hypothetical protein